MMRRRYWFAVVAVLVLLVGGEVAYWQVAADRLRAGYKSWVAAQVSHGWEVGSGAASVVGWPFSAGIIVPTLTLRHAGPTIPGNVKVASAGIMMSVALFNPTSLRLSLTGPVHVQAGDLPDVIVTGDETLVSIPLLQDGGPLLVTAQGRGLRLDAANGTWHGTVGLLNTQVAIAAVSEPDPSQPAATFTVVSEAIALPAVIKWPLGSNISSLSMDGRMNGLLPDAGDITRRAEAWRDGGGSLEITHLAVGWGPLGLTSAATLALDDQLQPMGSGSGRIVGYAETLDRLAAAGMLTKSAATAAKAVLSLMAGSTDADQPSSVDVPLTLQYRTLSMRQVPLIRLPEVDWPAR